MSLKTDRNGMFIYGMTNTDELGGFLKHKFSEHQIQQAYEYLVEASEGEARDEKYRHLEYSGNTLRKFITKVCHPCNVIEAALIVATQVFPARKWSGTAS